MHTQRRYATCPKGMIMKKKKKRKDAYPKKVCHMSTRHVEKKREEKNIYIDHVQEKNTKREIDHPMEFTHYPPKIFHTLAPLDQVV